ncbi:hypothetical protein HDF16_000791 [Granulicella aggregans]|uniref:Pyrrolo-quinoline quinone n=1 Tax=Granulicella aggregans TaxID=474949 RepID=A0A7W7ZAC9_9BACT|nr:PQQ-binding-like beta-propeller repeat protein [Granulicella aggregans]MBB5056122.1 hypothetical protein [Granulicella aggregans]
MTTQQTTSQAFFPGAIVLSLAMCLIGCGAGTTSPALQTSTPDFSLTVTPAALTLSTGASGATVSIRASGTGSFSGSVALAMDGLPNGVTASPASISLTSGTEQSVTLQASAQAATGTANVTLTGTSGTLKHTAALALTVAALATTPPPVAIGIDVTTYHYDNARDGLNAQETTLTPANVNSTTFGLLGLFPVDGKVDAQPLLVSDLKVTSSATANVLYVATEHDSVYALDATNGAQLWKTSILGSGETTSDIHSCNQIAPEIGITATPVIDRALGPSGTIFVVGMSKDNAGKYHQRLHALDLVTGTELSGSPTEIAATYPGTGDGSSNGTLTFDPGQYAERVGLLLLNGNLYTTWTSHCDIAPYTGWVIGYNETTLQQSSVLNLTPNGSDGAVWMSGFGLAADASSIYLLDANGTFDPGYTPDGFPSRSDFGNALLKIATTPKLAVVDYFEPWNTTAESDIDQDLGSGGAMLLPDMRDSAGKTRHLVVGAGKDGNIYLADRDDMGKINLSSPDNSNLYQQIPNGVASGAWSGPAFFNNTLYYGGRGDNLRAFPVANALLATAPSSISAVTFPYPGTTPAVSANGTRSGIVWAVESSPNSAGVLHAYDASNLATELYNSNHAASSRDAFGNGNKFITPMIANGRVYVGTQKAVAVFGLLNP